MLVGEVVFGEDAVAGNVSEEEEVLSGFEGDAIGLGGDVVVVEVARQRRLLNVVAGVLESRHVLLGDGCWSSPELERSWDFLPV